MCVCVCVIERVCVCVCVCVLESARFEGPEHGIATQGRAFPQEGVVIRV